MFGIECTELRKEINLKLLEGLNKFINNYYDEIRRSVKGQKIKNSVSYTLITKILMGTMGCVPAYDRFFVDGIKIQKVSTGNYNIKSILMLVDFYEQNLEKLENTRATLEACGLPYPQMKVLDMGFWQIGFDAEEDRRRKNGH